MRSRPAGASRADSGRKILFVPLRRELGSDVVQAHGRILTGTVALVTQFATAIQLAAL